MFNGERALRALEPGRNAEFAADRTLPSLAACSGAGGFTLGDYCKEKGQEWVRTFGTPHATHHPPPTTHHPPTTTTHPARVVVCIKHDLDQASTALQDDSHQGEVVVVVRWW